MEILQGLLDNLTALLAAHPLAGEWYMAFVRFLFPALAVLILYRAVRSLLRIPHTPENWGQLSLPNGTSLPLTHWENILGRSKTADIYLNYPSISRQHAALCRGEDENWTLYDLGSKGGTAVNGEKVASSVPVKLGDTITLGGVPLIFLPQTVAEREEQEAKRRAERPAAIWPSFLWLTVFQVLACLQLLVAAGTEATIAIPLAFLGLTVLMWLYYAALRATRCVGFEMETIAFFLSTLSLSITASSAQSSLFKQFLAILLGLALLIQPTAAQWWTSTRNAKTAAQFAARAEAQPTAPAAEETTAEPPEPERAYPELYAAMQDYNAEIYAGGQSGLTDPFAYEEAPLDLAAYGYDDDVLAVLWIPRLNLELPVYLGASRENLAKGAALLGQTSMPLGGENTNTVIAAHRGYYGAEMLRNVQQIQVGDKIQLTTPWETLIYRVSELKIIDPSDINAVLIQPGRDLLTLSTCHPYTRNSQRYLVIAEHDTAAADTTKEEDLQESAATWDETPRQVTVEDAGGSSIAEVAPQALTPLPGEGSAESEGSAISNTMIWLENNALWAGLVVIAAAVGIMVIWKKHRED